MIRVLHLKKLAACGGVRKKGFRFNYWSDSNRVSRAVTTREKESSNFNRGVVEKRKSEKRKKKNEGESDEGGIEKEIKLIDW